MEDTFIKFAWHNVFKHLTRIELQESFQINERKLQQKILDGKEIPTRNLLHLNIAFFLKIIPYDSHKRKQETSSPSIMRWAWGIFIPFKSIDIGIFGDRLEILIPDFI